MLAGHEEGRRRLEARFWLSVQLTPLLAGAHQARVGTGNAPDGTAGTLEGAHDAQVEGRTSTAVLKAVLTAPDAAQMVFESSAPVCDHGAVLAAAELTALELGRLQPRTCTSGPQLLRLR